MIPLLENRLSLFRETTSMTRCSYIPFFFFAVMCAAGALTAQTNTAALTIKKEQWSTVYLNNYPWRFQAGDDPGWAKPEADDSRWETLNPNFGNDSLPKNWEGYGWFRIWVRKSDPAATDTWGLYLNHDGASEIYWDGRKVAGTGRFSTSGTDWVARRDPYAILPVAIPDTLPHLLAIRYCNFRPAYPDFAGFQLWAGDMHTMNVQRREAQRFIDFILLSGAAQAILIVLHLLLFAFYPANKTNLYYSLFVFNTLAALYFRYLIEAATDPYTQAFAFRLFQSCVDLINFTQLLLLYTISYHKLPVRRLGLFGSITLCQLIYNGLHWEELSEGFSSAGAWRIATAVIAIIFFSEGARAIISAIRKGNRRLWLIAGGMVVLGIINIAVGMNLFQWFTFRQIMTAMSFTSLLIPVLFSIYLALDVADTNRRLARQLKENGELSARTLAQEQEKTKLIKEQAENLEQAVLERTEQVRQQARRLQEMDEAKSRFFVNLTHEFKTPLTLIMNPARELLDQAHTEEGKQYARYILQNSERLLQLISQLLDLSKLESGHVEICTEPLEMISWLRTYISHYYSLAGHRQIELSFSSPADQLWVNADPDKLEKILQNLLSNALKFTGSGGAVAVKLESSTNNYFTLTVSDTGSGIPENKLAYIFDRFYQADSSDTRAKGGAGIGLALTRELTRLLGGSITVTSTEGRGTTFVVMLPFTEVAGEQQNPVSVFPEPVPDPPDADGFNSEMNDELPVVLVVEDHADLQNFIRRTLSSSYNVITAPDGREGIGSALLHIPTLVITDLMMPEKDGYQVCHALKTDERTSHIPVVILTARADQESRVQGIETGADAYLAKPFDQRELLAIMENLIRTRHQLREKYGKNNVWLSAPETLPSIEQVFLERVRRAVETHIDDDQYSADRLGNDVGLSRTQLHRKLKALISQSPGELIRTVRMQYAYGLLRQRIATVSEVAYKVGYGNPANFSTTFSRHFGFPPSEVPAG